MTSIAFGLIPANGQKSSATRNLEAQLGDKVIAVPQMVDGILTVWARDWAPLGAKAANGELRLLDFNYYTGRLTDDYTPSTLGNYFPRVSVRFTTKAETL